MQTKTNKAPTASKIAYGIERFFRGIVLEATYQEELAKRGWRDDATQRANWARLHSSRFQGFRSAKR